MKGKRYLSVILPLLLLGAMAPGELRLKAVNAADNPGSHSSIHFPNKSHDFGSVHGNRMLVHKFVFYNRGREELFIKRVSAG